VTDDQQKRPVPGAGPRPRVLVVSGLYPAPDNHVFGAFVARQHEALTRLGVPHSMVVNRRWRPGAVRGAMKYGSLLARAIGASRRREFDVVLGHFLYPAAWIARLAARAGGVPYVVFAHGMDVSSVQRPGALARACLRATREAACVVTNSRAMEARLREELALPQGVPVEVINMGVDRTVFRPIEGAREVFGWPHGERIALFAGNLIARKAPDALLEAFATLSQRGACDRVVFAGDGPMRSGLEAAAARRGLAAQFLGPLEPDRLALAMSAVDVFVLPSRTEPLGVVLLEAMACGTPCVATRVGGIPEIVGEECGLLVEPDDPAALADAVAEVLASGKQGYSAACLAAAASNDLDANTARLVGVLARVAAARR
jgi:teichuronic acid biosynthesis glycosyltransferase TuaC